MTYNYPCGGEAFASYRSKIWAIWITISIQHNPIVLFCYARILISTVMSLSEMLLHSQQKRIDFLSVHYPLSALGLWSVIWMIPGILKANRVQPRGNRIDGIGIASCLYGETLFMAKLLKSAAWFTWINTHTHTDLRRWSILYVLVIHLRLYTLQIPGNYHLLAALVHSDMFFDVEVVTQYKQKPLNSYSKKQACTHSGDEPQRLANDGQIWQPTDRTKRVRKCGEVELLTFLINIAYNNICIFY